MMWTQIPPWPPQEFLFSSPPDFGNSQLVASCQLGFLLRLNCFFWIEVGCLWHSLIAKCTENNAWSLHLQFTSFSYSSLFDFKGSPLGLWHMPNSNPLSYSSKRRFCLNFSTDWTFHWQIPVSEMEKRVWPTESSGERRSPSLDERRWKSSILGWNAFFHKHVVEYRQIFCVKNIEVTIPFLHMYIHTHLILLEVSTGCCDRISRFWWGKKPECLEKTLEVRLRSPETQST